MAELAYAGDLKSSAERLAGSNPAAPTRKQTAPPRRGAFFCGRTAVDAEEIYKNATNTSFSEEHLHIGANNTNIDAIYLQKRGTSLGLDGDLAPLFF